ncbi:MAG: ATP-binding cassette domain-containing protein [Terricaulis sp.]|nr:ATP-binding cassette domain-containing protein [Terricaulis sp.]
MIIRSETKQRLAYIPETVMLYGMLTGLENLEYFARLGGHTEYSRSDLIGFLDRVGLQSEAVNKRVSTYSKGMRQKVGVAIALAKKAKALLLDEPTSGLDPRASNEFSELLRQFQADGARDLDGDARSFPRQGNWHAHRHHAWRQSRARNGDPGCQPCRH